MHEMSLCRSILEIVLRNAKEHHHSKIKKIELEVGVLAAIDQSAMCFSFEVLARNTKAENALLDFIHMDAQALCKSCHLKTKIKQYYDPCSYCGKFGLTIISGEILRVKSMEVE